MVTDTQRILRTDPGRPEVCNVCQLHRFFGPDYEEIWDGERTARTGCVDTKRLLADRIIAHYAPARERYLELLAHPDRDRRDPRGGRRPPPAEGRGDDGRGPPADGAALGAVERLVIGADYHGAEGRGHRPLRRRRPIEPREVRPTMTMVTERQRRWLTAVLVLGTLILGDRPHRASSARSSSPSATSSSCSSWPGCSPSSSARSSRGLTRLIPLLPRVGAVVLVYAALVGAHRPRRRPGRRRPRPVDRRLRRQRADAPRRPAGAPRARGRSG